MDRQPAAVIIGPEPAERLQYRDILGAEPRPADDDDQVGSWLHNHLANGARDTVLHAANLGASSVTLDQGAQHRSVCVVDAAAAQFLSRLVQISSGDDEAHPRGSDHLDKSDPGRAQKSDIGGAYPAAGAQQQRAARKVVAALIDVCAGDGGLDDLDDRGTWIVLDMVREHDRVGAPRCRRSAGHFCRDRQAGGKIGSAGFREAEGQRVIDAGTESIMGANRIAVGDRAIERRVITCSREILCQNPAR